MFKFSFAVCISVNVGIYQSLYPLNISPSIRVPAVPVAAPSAFLIFTVCALPSPILGVKPGPVVTLPTPALAFAPSTPQTYGWPNWLENVPIASLDII